MSEDIICFAVVQVHLFHLLCKIMHWGTVYSFGRASCLDRLCSLSYKLLFMNL